MRKNKEKVKIVKYEFNKRKRDWKEKMIKRHKEKIEKRKNKDKNGNV